MYDSDNIRLIVLEKKTSVDLLFPLLKQGNEI